MAKITVNKISVTDGSFIHEITWTFDSGQTRAIKLMEESYKALEDYFSKPKKQKKKPADAPTLDEVKQYFKQEGYTEDTAIRFYKYYSSMDWYDNNGKPVLRWKSKAISTWFKPENKIKEETKSTNKPSFFQ